jgi:hypothetical protein
LLKIIVMDAPNYDLALLVPRSMYAADVRKALAAVEQAALSLPGERVDTLVLDRRLREIAAEQGMGADSLFQALRVALRGNLASPGLLDTMAALGRDGVRLRLATALRRLSDMATTPH